MDEIERIKEMITKIAETTEKTKNLSEKVNDILKKINEFIFMEREKYYPCFCVPQPTPRYWSVKLWRKNKALFRPYRQARRGYENIRHKEALYELF